MFSGETDGLEPPRKYCGSDQGTVGYDLLNEYVSDNQNIEYCLSFNQSKEKSVNNLLGNSP